MNKEFGEHQPNQPDRKSFPREEGKDALGLPINPQEQSQPQSDSEFKRRLEGMRASYANSRVEEMRAVYEQNSNLFAIRAREALEELVKARIPHAERTKESTFAESRSFWETSGYTRESLLPHGRLLKTVSENAERRAYVKGLKAAFGFLYDRITGQNKWPQLPVEGEPQSHFQEGESAPKK